MYTQIFLAILVLCESQYLNNVPLTFKMNGLESYTPNTGGIPIQGYSLTLGFDRFQWLGVMFMTMTSTNNYDVLILQRSTTQNGGVYSCQVTDYYLSPGRNTTLMLDSMTNMDLKVTQSATTSAFKLTFPRTTGNTNGQDWTVSDFVKICFFTSDKNFTTATWSRQYQACFGYQVNNYASTFRGSYLGNMTVEGVQANLYGGLYWGYGQLQLLWVRSSLVMTNTSSLIIKIGDQISSIIGYDYFVCGSGDYYGEDISNMQDDLSYSGYNDGICSFSSGTTSSFLYYSRNINTYDQFDNVISDSFKICVIGDTENCQSFKMSYGDPVMYISSALTISQLYILIQAILIIFLGMI